MAELKSAPPSGYVPEVHLREIAVFAGRIKAQALAALDLAPGLRVADVGCGPGIDTSALAAQVGPSGRVVGIDLNMALLRAAAAAAGITTRPGYIRGDARMLPLASGSMHRCRCDRVLQHIVNPGQAIGEVARVLMPGGRCVLLEPDWGSLSIDCDNAALERRIVALVGRHFASGFVGRTLVRLCHDSGLATDEVSVEPLVWRDFALFCRTSFPAAGATEALMAAGALTADDWAQFAALGREADRRGTFFATAAMTIVGCRRH